MHTLEVSFSPLGERIDLLVDAAASLLSAWYRNGQVSSPDWALAAGDSELRAFVLSPTSESTDEKHANQYVRDALEILRSQFSVRPKMSVLGRDPESLEPCTCGKRHGHILFTHYLTVESPLRCAECFLPIPLYEVPPTRGQDYYDILTWVADYKACDTLQMHTQVGERFGETQLMRHDSPLSRAGREIGRSLAESHGVPVYYYLNKCRGRTEASERARVCPGCGGPWLLTERWHGKFDFRCDACSLLSNIAWSLSS
jgi:predicted  nucleic acid-binding Zn ribbon protein